MDNADKIRRLADIGEALHGERWQRPLGRQLGVSTALMSSIVTGDRRVTPDFEERLSRALYDDIAPRLDAIAAEVRARALEIATELQIELEPTMAPELGGPT